MLTTVLYCEDKDPSIRLIKTVKIITPSHSQIWNSTRTVVILNDSMPQLTPYILNKMIRRFHVRSSFFVARSLRIVVENVSRMSIPCASHGISNLNALNDRMLKSFAASQHRAFADHLPAKTSRDGVVGHPIDFDVNSKIEGNESQIVTIELEPGQVLRAESGAMMYMTSGVTMNTTTGGGLSEGFRRMMTGQNFFISDYMYDGDPGTKGTVALGTDFPSKIIRLNVEEYGGKLVCQKGALLYVRMFENSYHATVVLESQCVNSFVRAIFLSSITVVARILSTLKWNSLEL